MEFGPSRTTSPHEHMLTPSTSKALSFSGPCLLVNVKYSRGLRKKLTNICAMRWAQKKPRFSGGKWSFNKLLDTSNMLSPIDLQKKCWEKHRRCLSTQDLLTLLIKHINMKTLWKRKVNIVRILCSEACFVNFFSLREKKVCWMWEKFLGLFSGPWKTVHKLCYAWWSCRTILHAPCRLTRSQDNWLWAFAHCVDVYPNSQPGSLFNEKLSSTHRKSL